jgi:methylthioribose-1-phosphate isomerase
MKVGDKDYRSIWPDESDHTVIKVIDQEKLPFSFEIRELRTVEDIYNSIMDMTVRGAPVIGAAGAFGIYLATLELSEYTDWHDHLKNAARYLISSRPTAVNLSWAVNSVLDAALMVSSEAELVKTTFDAAMKIYNSEINNCIEIGKHGLRVIEELSKTKNGSPVNILTHCNAGWLACIDYGTAIAPVYLAKEKNIPVHVWVDETRPRNQGARLTAWELGNANIPYTLIADNTGGHLMQNGMVDIVITGSDRTTSSGDVANKIGTYLKALAAKDNNIPFYVALPSSSFDFSISDGIKEIAIEERDPSEITDVTGISGGKITSVRICPDNTHAANWGFDITPSRLVTGFITERGICGATRDEIKKMFSDKFSN